MITKDHIDLWRNAPTENQNLEFKEAKNSFDTDKLNAYCVALANEGGGHLLLGVADKIPRNVVGSRAFQNPVKCADSLFRAIGFRVEVEEVSHPDGRVVVFTIPARPRGTAYHLDGKYLMRSGSSLSPMSEDRLRTIFSEGGPDWLEEPTLSGLDERQVVDLLDVQTFFDLINASYPSTRKAVINRLVSERLVDARPEGLSIRRLGGLLLADCVEKVGLRTP